MPDYQFASGSTTPIPGVTEYKETVILNQPGPTPSFMVPVLVGDAPSGIPYNFDSLKKTTEPALGPFRMQRTDAVVSDTWGIGSDIAVAFRNSQDAGLPMAFITTTCALTRAQVIATSTGPVNEMYIYSRLFGAPGGHTMVKYASNILTITPVQRFAMLSAAVATTDTRVYVTGNDPDISPIGWMSKGMTVYLGDNDTANFAVVVADTGRQLNSSGQWQYYFDLTAAAGTAVEVSTKYGAVVLYGDPEVSPTFTTGNGIITWINQNSKVLAAEAHASFTNALLVSVSSSTAIKDLGSTWGTVTVGTSPASTTSTWASFLTAYVATYWDQFRSLFSARPYLHLFLTSDATNHAAARAFAVNRRYYKVPVSLLLSAAYTDTSTSATDSTNPGYRARALNHQDISLFAGQFGYLAPYLTLAASAFGQLAANGSKYSVTRKVIDATGGTVTKFWDEANTGQLTYLIQNGVITYMMDDSNPPQWVFTAGVNTNQDRAVVWSPQTNTTCMMSARNSVNEFWEGLHALLASYSGRNGVSNIDVGQAIYAYCTSMRDKRQIIRAFGDPTLVEDANTATWSVTSLNIEPLAETLFLAAFINIIIR